MKLLTDEELTVIRERAEKASGEEWVRLEDGTVIALTGDGIAFDLVVREVESYNHVNDEHFIAHAREDIPKLLAEVERLREVIIEAIADIEAISPHEAKKTLRKGLE